MNFLKEPPSKHKINAHWKQPDTRIPPNNAVQDLTEKLADGTLPARQKWRILNKKKCRSLQDGRQY